jgi:AraC-like DNA-binding protein
MANESMWPNLFQPAGRPREQHMLETDACLTDIARQCGFADQAHFCRRFRDSTGETPAVWRRARGRSKAVEPRGHDVNSNSCAAH